MHKEVVGVATINIVDRSLNKELTIEAAAQVHC